MYINYNSRMTFIISQFRFEEIMRVKNDCQSHENILDEVWNLLFLDKNYYFI